VAWFFLSLLAAAGLATVDALTKRFFSNLSPYSMGMVRLIYAFPWLLAAMLFFPWAVPDRTFWLCIIVSLPLEIIAFVCYMKALRVSPLSLSIPFLAFTPMFIIITGHIILGENLRSGGFWGIALIVIGSFLLNLSKTKEGILAPIKAIFKEPGSQLMLFVSFIYSFTAPLGKLAIIHSNAYFFGAFYDIALTVAMLSFWPLASDKNESPNLLFRKPWIGVIIGIVGAITTFSHVVAISQVQAAYMISLKRMSLIFAVLYGASWFHEEKIMERMAGTILMVIGALLVGWLR
jgi:uncharacterized membrane protein